jgi:hypothetical protein
MATRAQLFQALKAADQAGEAEDAHKIAQMIEGGRYDDNEFVQEFQAEDRPPEPSVGASLAHGAEFAGRQFASGVQSAVGGLSYAAGDAAGALGFPQAEKALQGGSTLAAWRPAWSPVIRLPVPP